MELYLAGINHNDPLMRVDLVDWLKDLQHQHQSDPCFVAVEWGKAAYDKIVASRIPFEQKLKQQWGAVDDHLVGPLAAAIGYEGDAHRDVWPDLRPIWLDSRRKLTPLEQFTISSYEDARLGVYAAHLDHQIPLTNIAGTLQALSDNANKGQQQWSNNPRDKSWARQIGRRASQGGCDWAVVIAGHEHFSPNHPGNLRGRLDKNGTCTDIPGVGHLVRRKIVL